MEFKNRKIKMFNNTYRLVYEDQVFDENGNWVYGLVDKARRIIHISVKDIDCNDLPKEDIEMTVRHELFHIILDRLYMEESDNETLVEWLASATYSLNKQGLDI